MNRKPRIWSNCLVGSVIFLLSQVTCSPPSAPIPPQSGTQIIAFGDSLVRGKGASPGKDWVSLVSTQLGVPILNKGRNGDTTRAALARLDRDVIQNDPRVVIVCLGGNDVLRRLPQKETFKNLTRIIDRIQETGAGVVLVGIRGGLLVDPYDDAFESLANTKRTYFVPDIMENILGNKARLADAVHPNDLGHQHVAKRIFPVVNKALGLTRTRVDQPIQFFE